MQYCRLDIISSLTSRRAGLSFSTSSIILIRSLMEFLKYIASIGEFITVIAKRSPFIDRFGMLVLEG